MRYQLRLPDNRSIESFADELAGAAVAAIGGAADGGAPRAGLRGRVDEALRGVLDRELKAFDVCGMMHACTDAVTPATDRPARILQARFPNGPAAFLAELADEAARAAGVAPGPQRASLMPAVREGLRRVLAPQLFESELCGNDQCDRVAVEVPVFGEAARA